MNTVKTWTLVIYLVLMPIGFVGGMLFITWVDHTDNRSKERDMFRYDRTVTKTLARIFPGHGFRVLCDPAVGNDYVPCTVTDVTNEYPPMVMECRRGGSICHLSTGRP